MSRWTHYLERAGEILETYHGETPLPPVLKAFFREHRQMGATDRRYVSDLVYGYYRLGHANRDMEVPERLLLAYALTHPGPSPLLEALRAEKTVPDPKPESIFPWLDHLSEGIDPIKFSLSHLHQPDVYIRIRPGFGAEVRNALKDIPFQEAGQEALRLPAGTALQDVLPTEKAYVVQDLSSQRTETLIRKAFEGQEAPRVWDCCAASGGKSILIKDILPAAKLTVSDIRESTLHNLEKRFAAAGLRYERAFVADLARPDGIADLVRVLPEAGEFDVILADVPCTGSGTWSRTPEQLYFFREEKITGYMRRQQAILRNVVQVLKPGGFFLFVTCSVFALENEHNVGFLTELGLETQEQQVFAGYDQRADTLFGALLRKTV
jgi:16S rRNA (cytosine967-C5)-methyltransferase